MNRILKNGAKLVFAFALILALGMGTENAQGATTYAVNAITETGALTITAGGALGIVTGTNAINIGADAAAKTITIGNATGATAVAVNSGTGDITLTTADDLVINGVAASDYTIGAATTTGTITIGGTAQTGAIAIGDTAASIVSEISIGGGNGVKTAINIGDGTGANGINIGGAASTVTVNGAFVASEEVIFSGIETIAAGGTTTALDLTESLHSIDADAGGDIFTLADGTIGQVMTIAMLSATGVATITPANLAGGTSVTLNAAGETVILQFVDTEWYIMGGNAYTVI